MFKGQAHMMEYILMTLFIVIIISILIFFLMSWQFTQLRATESKTEGEKALFIMKFFIKSPYFTKDESIFDDLNMLAFKEIEDGGCDELNVVFGRDWFARIYEISTNQVECNSMSNYGNCNAWSFCEEPDRRSFKYLLPVNIFMNSDNTNHLGVLEVGVYHEESSD
jgi:hypothetical protein